MKPSIRAYVRLLAKYIRPQRGRFALLAAALLGSPGQALNTFRDDAQVVEDLASWMIDQLSFVVFAVAAVATFLRTSPLITGICVVPLLGVVAAARVVGTHIRRFRDGAATQPNG
jgi:ABC-type multidrug transport system fused ATPase/permease subunit